MKKVEIDNLEEWYKNIKENGCILSEHQSNYDGSKDYWGFADAEEEAEEEFSWYTYRSPDDIPETVDEVFYESLINFLIRG